MFPIALFALLHVLVFVYWLGGDLGAFYTSRYLTAPNVPPDRRLFAAKIVGDVDMAPRSALILTLPTGLALAQSKGWLAPGWMMVALITIAALLWLAAAWRIHIKHGGAAPALVRADRLMRYAAIGGSLGATVAGLTGALPIPLFLSLKFAIFGGCVVLGLLIRAVLRPLGPALEALSDSGSADEGAAQLRRVLERARPLVLLIWISLISAALLGLWTPQF